MRLSTTIFMAGLTNGIHQFRQWRGLGGKGEGRGAMTMREAHTFRNAITVVFVMLPVLFSLAMSFANSSASIVLHCTAVNSSEVNFTLVLKPSTRSAIMYTQYQGVIQFNAVYFGDIRIVLDHDYNDGTHERDVLNRVTGILKVTDTLEAVTTSFYRCTSAARKF